MDFTMASGPLKASRIFQGTDAVQSIAVKAMSIITFSNMLLAPMKEPSTT
jgi:hypothetical protein